jgi:hypothetical protein
LPSQVWRGGTVSEAVGEGAEFSAGVGFGEERKRLNIKGQVVKAHSMKN